MRAFRPARTPVALSRTGLAATLLVVALVSACGKADNAAPAAAPPPPEVGVVTVSLGDVGLVTELPGRLEASRVAQVRARAAGILQKRLFTRGQRCACRPGLVQH